MNGNQRSPFQRAVLGKTGLEVGRLGLAAGYGMPAAAVERAFEEGMNYLYWGSPRRRGFAEALRNLSRRRDQMVLVIQCYSPFGWHVQRSLEQALRKLGFDYADVLLLGMWNRPPPERILDVARKLKEQGRIRFLAVSTHRRPLVPRLARQPDYDVVHLRYNAVHPGAERDVFPHLPAGNRPGIVSFTATSWKQLLRSRRLPRGERAPTAGDCYRFVLSNPAVDVCLSGAASLDQIEQALQALRRGPMSEEEMAWMRRVGAAIYRRSFRKD